MITKSWPPHSAGFAWIPNNLFQCAKSVSDKIAVLASLRVKLFRSLNASVRQDKGVPSSHKNGRREYNAWSVEPEQCLECRAQSNAWSVEPSILYFVAIVLLVSIVIALNYDFDFVLFAIVFLNLIPLLIVFLCVSLILRSQCCCEFRFDSRKHRINVMRLQHCNYVLEKYGPREGVRRIKSMLCGRLREFLCYAKVHLCLPEELEVLFTRMNAKRLAKPRKPIRCERLPDASIDFGGFSTADYNRRYNFAMMRKLCERKVDKVALLGSTTLGDRQWPFPVYCDANTFKRFVAMVIQSPSKWRPFFLRGELTYPLFVEAQSIFHLAVTDVKMTSGGDMKFVRIAGACVALAKAAKTKDAGMFASTVAMMSDILKDFVDDFGILDLVSLNKQFPGLELEEEEVVMLNPAERGPYDFLPSHIRYSREVRAIVALTGAVAASSFFRDSAMVKYVVECADWKSLSTNANVVVAAATASREIASGLNRVFNSEGDWRDRIPKFFSPPKWVEGVSRGQDILRGVKTRKTVKDLVLENQEIDRLLYDLSAESHVELTRLKIELRDRKLENLKIIQNEQDRSIPMVIFLGGTPGVGKTTLISSLVEMLNRMDGVETAAQDVINVNLYDKFPASTGLSEEARFIVMNDVPSDYTNFPNQDLTSLDLFMQQIVDSNVFAFKAAAVEDKGVVLRNVKYLIITCNSRSFKMVDDAFKLERRVANGALYWIDFADKDARKQDQIVATRLYGRANHKHFVFDCTTEQLNRVQLIKDIRLRKKQYDAIEADRLCKFGRSAQLCRCGMSVEMHVCDGVLQSFCEDCDCVSGTASNVSCAVSLGMVNSYVDPFAMSKLWLQDVHDHGFHIPVVGWVAFRKSYLDLLLRAPLVLNSTIIIWAAVEEIVKRIPSYIGCDFRVPFVVGPFSTTLSAFSFAFGFLESLPWLWAYRSDPRTCMVVLFARCGTTFMHTMASGLPFLPAVVYHSLYNICGIAMYSQGSVKLIINYAVEQCKPLFEVIRGFIVGLWTVFFWVKFGPVYAACYVAWTAFGEIVVDTFKFFKNNAFQKRFFERLLRSLVVGRMAYLKGRLRDYPLAHAWICAVYDRLYEIAQWFHEHRLAIAAFIAVGVVATIMSSRIETKMTGGSFSLLAEQVDESTMVTPVVASAQSMPGLQANRVWTQRTGLDVTLARLTKNVSSKDLITLSRQAVVQALIQREFASGRRDNTVNLVFMLSPQILVINKHYLWNRHDNEWIQRMCININGHAMWYSYDDVVKFEDNELVFVESPYKMCRDLTKFLVEKTVLTAVAAMHVRLGEESVAHCTYTQFTEPNTKHVYPAWNWPGTVHDGECGTPLVIDGNNSAILGLVSASLTRFGAASGLASPLDKEIVDKVYEKLGKPKLSSVKMTWSNEFLDVRELSAKSELLNVGSPHLWAIGTLNKPSRSFASKFRKTELFEAAASKMSKEYKPPNRLRGLDASGKWTSAVMSTFKYVDLQDTSSFAQREAAMKAYLEDCLVNSSGVKLAPLSLKEAFFGKPEIGAERVPFSTSIGPTLRHFGSNKFDLFFRKEDNSYALVPEVTTKVNEMLGDFERGTIVPVRLDFTPKDELRPAEKVDACKVRLFSVVDFIYNVTLRMLALPLISFLMAYRFDSCIFGYMNAGSAEWGQLAEWLKAPGGATFDLDFSAFDTSHSPGFFAVVAQFKWLLAKRLGYEDRWAFALYTAMFSLNIQIAIYLVDAFLKFKGMPSGVTVTLIFNSIVNGVLLRMAFAVLIPEIPLSDFRKHVHEAMVGDDNVVGVSDYVKDRFNPVTIFPLYQEWGYIATPASKEATVLSYGPLEERTFLKRRFRWDKDVGMWFAPIEEDSIWKGFTYQRVNADIEPPQRLKMLGENAQREFFLYGRDIFLQKQEEIFKMFQDSPLSVRPDRLRYEELLETYKAGTFRTEDL